MMSWSTTMWGSAALAFLWAAMLARMGLGAPTSLSMMLAEVASEWSRVAMAGLEGLGGVEDGARGGRDRNVLARKKSDEIAKKEKQQQKRNFWFVN